MTLKREARSTDEGTVGTSPLPAYDPRVIEQFAEKLYRKASAFVAGSVVIGASLGAAFGAVPLTSLGAAWPVPSYLGFATLLLGGLFGSAIGYVIGDTRSFGYRLQAQSALCQLQAERNTAILVQAVSAARASAPAPAPRQAQPVQQPPVVQQQHQQQAAAPHPPEAANEAPPAASEDAPAAPQPPLSPPVSASRVA
jgi:hypothetical protein